MPKYTSQITTVESAEKVNSLITNFLDAQGYKSTKNKKGNEWRKGFYWFKFAHYAYTQGIIDLEVWNYCPYPGMGSFLLYFIGINELKALLKDLEQLLGKESTPRQAFSLAAKPCGEWSRLDAKGNNNGLFRALASKLNPKGPFLSFSPICFIIFVQFLPS